ncbi:hypothetical protein [Pontibacter sp. SGAir0037]|uniref:hypothetical protein n=1 Tax=Pontibacter sp. SGAir0037 TaxID=2571030 RepID=UPI0010CCCBFA|nr:hypothetical protein [Pontibacter sp. SGAir0037]QCR23938.1 hypothetical protein C1N53_17330 [Pontibacter sp. SGAir0037]
MNKNVLAVFAAVCGLMVVSCDTPSDKRPETKVSVDKVAPGQRNTPNVSDRGAGQSNTHRDDVMMNHDEGANSIQPGESVHEDAKTNEAENAVKH